MSAAFSLYHTLEAKEKKVLDSNMFKVLEHCHTSHRGVCCMSVSIPQLLYIKSHEHRKLDSASKDKHLSECKSVMFTEASDGLGRHHIDTQQHNRAVSVCFSCVSGTEEFRDV